MFYAIAWIVMLLGCALGFNFSFSQTLANLKLRLPKRRQNMKALIRQSKKIKKDTGVLSIFKNSKKILEITHKADRFPMFCTLSLILFTVGMLFAGILGNLFLVPVLAFGFAILPFLYILLTYSKFREELNEELETSLSIVTTSYLRSENLLQAVRENLEFINPPVKDLFAKFIVQADKINPDIPKLLEEMKRGIDHSVFREWVNTMISCQENRALKSTLLPIVGKLSEMRIVSDQLNTKMYEPLKDIIGLAVLLVANIPLIHQLNIDWYNSLMHTVYGQIVLTVCAAGLFIALIGTVREIKPVEYKR